MEMLYKLHDDHINTGLNVLSKYCNCNTRVLDRLSITETNTSNVLDRLSITETNTSNVYTTIQSADYVLTEQLKLECKNS